MYSVEPCSISILAVLLVMCSLNMSSHVKLHRSSLGSSLATFQNFMGKSVLTLISDEAAEKLDVMSLGSLPLPSLCAHCVMVSPHLLPAVAYVLSVVSRI